MSQNISELYRLSHHTKYLFKHGGISKVLMGIFGAYFYKKLKYSLIDLSKERTIDVHGCKFALKPNDKGISAELLLFGSHEPLSTVQVTSILKPGMTCIDLGSNIGYYVVLESKIVGKNGKVIAIEASPDNYKYLQKNSKLQNFSNIETYNFVLSDHNGKVNFLTKPISNWSRVMSDDEIPEPSDKISRVPMKTLDSFIEEEKIDRVDFARMDVEGYEYNIYQGMHKTIEKFKPALFIEFHLSVLGTEKTKKFLSELKNDGYETNYYTPRLLDNHFLADKKYIQNYSIDEIIQKLDEGSIPIAFTLFLSHI